MPATSNTSPIIVLAKIGRLELLKSLYGTVIISPFVRAECVDRGRELGASDVVEIERAIDEGWVKVAKPTRRQNQTIQRLVNEARVGFGEAGALALARDKKMLAILDDKEARTISKSWGLQHTSTVMVLYEAFVKGLISYDELVEDLSRLTRVMWISTDAVTEIIRKAREVRR